VRTMADELLPDGQRVATRQWMRGVVVVIAAAAVVVGLGAWFGSSFVLACGCTTPAASPAVDQPRAGQIARDYFATAHGTGIKLTDVRETDNGITNDTACGAKWEVLMGGTVTDSSGTSYFSTMHLCVDPATGTVTRGPAG
jgi:hypothetical protein